jgi:hypothetical protein
MSAYFPVPPTLSLSGYKNKIIGSITFLNYPNNRLKPIFSRNQYKDIVYLGIFCFRNQKWHLLQTNICKSFDFSEVSRSKLDVDDDEMVVAVPKKSNIFEQTYINLPSPDSLKIDNSIVAQRASLNFTYLNSTSSYQGEYPYNMSTLRKGSLLSFDGLKQPYNSSNRNFLILINISKNNYSSDKIKIKVFNPIDKKKFKFLYAKRNAFSIFETSKYQDDIDNLSTIFLTSNSATFIPLMVSIDLNSNQLSVEHTHPPTEYFFGNGKIENVKSLKKQWID